MSTAQRDSWDALLFHLTILERVVNTNDASGASSAIPQGRYELEYKPGVALGTSILPPIVRFLLPSPFPDRLVITGYQALESRSCWSA